jgi:hypothetical protein
MYIWVLELTGALTLTLPAPGDDVRRIAVSW